MTNTIMKTVHANRRACQVEPNTYGTLPSEISEALALQASSWLDDLDDIYKANGVKGEYDEMFFDMLMEEHFAT